MDVLRQNDTSKLYPVSACQELAKEYFQKNGPQDDYMGANFSTLKKETHATMPKTEQTVKLPKVMSNLSKQAIAEESPDIMQSDRESSMQRGSRGSFTSIRGRFGHRKGKEISEKEKVDKLVKIYFK